MQFTNYNDFRAKVQLLIDGDELSSNFSVNTLDLLIQMGEARVFNGDAMTAGLRASTMVEPLSLTVTNNVAAIPADAIELKELRFDGKKPLDIVPLEKLHKLIAEGASYGQIQFVAQDGDNITFWPAASSNVLGSYYGRPDDLEVGGLHTTFVRYPEVFLFAALYEAALFLGMDSKAPIWEQRYRQYADGANHSERMRVYGGGRLRQRTS